MNISSDHLGIVPPPADVEPGRGSAHNCLGEQQCRSARKIEPALNHMLAHLGEPLCISKLSAIAGVSNSYFFWLFKSATGSTPIDYFIRLRVRRARELLRNPALSVKATACLLGYSDQYYFSRVFKSVTGVAPRNYRRLFQNVMSKNQGHRS